MDFFRKFWNLIFTCNALTYFKFKLLALLGNGSAGNQLKNDKKNSSKQVTKNLIIEGFDLFETSVRGGFLQKTALILVGHKRIGDQIGMGSLKHSTRLE